MHCELTLPIPMMTLLANGKFATGKKFTIIERGCAEYHDLSAAGFCRGSRVEGKSYHLQENSYLKAVICRAFGGLSASEKEGKIYGMGKTFLKK